jgi:tRNA A-37 threonylcarbamoyl transferase component Bud32
MANFRVIKAALVADGEAWASALAEGRWQRAARVLKRDGRTTVYRTRLLEREVVIKCWELGRKARLQAVFGATHGMRHWRGAARLRKAGIATAWTWALLRGKQGTGPVEILVMEALPGKTILQHLADRDLSVREEHALAAAVGAQIALMARHALHNRDHKPSNLIVTNPPLAAVAVIDCVGIGRRFRLDRMLASLVIEPSGVGHRPRRTLMMRTVRACIADAPEIFAGGSRRWRKEVWRLVSRVVQNHGDPTPRVDPLTLPER